MDRLIRLSLFLCTLSLTACSGSSSGGSGGEPDWGDPYLRDAEVAGQTEVVGKPDWVRPDGTAAGRLQFVDPDQYGDSCAEATRCEHWVSLPASGHALTVRYLVSEVLVAGDPIRFEVTRDEYGIAQLDSAASITNSAGQASVSLSAVASDSLPSGECAQVEVQVSHGTDPEVSPIVFAIEACKKQPSLLKVDYDYTGTVSLNEMNLALHRQSPDASAPDGFVPDAASCAALFEQLREDPEQHMGAEVTAIEAWPRSWEFARDALEFISPDDPRKYTGVVVGRDGNGVPRVMGCNEEDGRVELTQSRTTLLRVELLDIWPRLAGKYEVDNRFNLLTALPDDARIALEWVVDFLQNPARASLDLLCTIEQTEQVLEGMCDWVFDELPDGERVLTATGTIIVEIINTIIRNLGEDTVWGDILVGGADIGEILTNLRLGSTITFLAEPAFPSGLIDISTTEEEWNSVSFRWALALTTPEQRQDPDQGWVQVSLTTIVDDPIVGRFSGSVNAETQDGHAAGTLLTVDEHPLAIKYGAILNYLLQKEILPRLAGGIPADGLPVIDTYEKMFKALLAGRQCLVDETTGGFTCCEAFARSVMGEDPLIPESIVSTGCEMLVEFGSLYIETLLVSLDAETGETFVIGTTANTPCLLDDANQDGAVDTLGTIDEWGHWTATLTVAGEEVTIEGRFLGSSW